MKKMKLFLLAAMIVGVGSAFTTTKASNTQLWVKGPNGTGITIEQAENEFGGSCDESQTETHCRYTDQALTTPEVGSPLGTFVYP